jgi:hypothetical protein
MRADVDATYRWKFQIFDILRGRRRVKFVFATKLFRSNYSPLCHSEISGMLNENLIHGKYTDRGGLGLGTGRAMNI